MCQMSRYSNFESISVNWGGDGACIWERMTALHKKVEYKVKPLVAGGGI